MENLIRAGEVAAMVNVSVQTIYRYVMNKEMPFIKLGRAVRFSPAEVSLWLDGRKKGKAVNLNEEKLAEIINGEKINATADCGVAVGGSGTEFAGN